jgi:hypothetical protein
MSSIRYIYMVAVLLCLSTVLSVLATMVFAQLLLEATIKALFSL